MVAANRWAKQRRLIEKRFGIKGIKGLTNELAAENLLKRRKPVPSGKMGPIEKEEREIRTLLSKLHEDISLFKCGLSAVDKRRALRILENKKLNDAQKLERILKEVPEVADIRSEIEMYHEELSNPFFRRIYLRKLYK